MTIKELNEMALINDNIFGMPRIMDYQNDFNKLKLIADKIQPLNNKLYSGIEIFYLTDKNNNYLGHLEYDYLDNDKIRIRSTYSKQKGFYELMFKFILIKTSIKMIFGDDEQTQNAIDSWKKQLSKYHKKVYNTETKEIEEFDDSKENLYWVKIRGNHKKYLVGLSESDNYIKESYNGILSLINKREKNGSVTDLRLEYLTRFDITLNDALELLED